MLLEETLALLAVRRGGIYVDGTFGRGGHSSAILSGLGSAGCLLAIDRDPLFMTCAEQVASEMNAWAESFLGRRIIGDLRKQLGPSAPHE